MLALVGNVGEFFVALSAIAGFFYGGWRWVVRPAWAVVTDIRRDVRLQGEKVDGLIAQVGTNGGQTIFEKLQQQDDQLARVNSLADVMPVPFFETDAYGRVTYANSACERLTGNSMEELRQMEWVDRVDRRERSDYVTEWLQAIDHRRSFERDVTVVSRDGKRVRVNVRAEPIRSADRVIGWRGVLNPVEPA